MTTGVHATISVWIMVDYLQVLYGYWGFFCRGDGVLGESMGYGKCLLIQDFVQFRSIQFGIKK